ncbi:uncharacterized protein LOC131942427 [Physella acuta]|uniref:uncharacterized protein LOC131942427 n=1 Tax=Physella acuta TaxID=109671 RepID=UPI0027DD0274|nr:uncharacterized protein LOC131942427 [Physella acuta]
MARIPRLLSLLLMCIVCCSGQLDLTLKAIGSSIETLRNDVKYKDGVMGQIVKQVMLNRFQDEERVRAEGDSGIVSVRNYNLGTDNFHTSTHIGFGFSGIHDHSQTANTLGMGEVTAVLNGVQFRTSHNDFQLRRPSTTSRTWLETEPIPPPPVPPSVLSLSNVTEAIAEMREYFRAFQTQDTTIRDYRPYFKPVLCYLEGTWLVNITETDNTDRARTEAYLGSATNASQTVSSLPSTILGIDDVTNEPILGQWFYRTLCYPLEENLPTSYFTAIDDMSYRYPRGLPYTANPTTRGTRFLLDDKSAEGYRGYTLLDRLVARIPGLDNVPGNLSEKTLGLRDMMDAGVAGVLNIGYYNRQYRDLLDAMNRNGQIRGFSDGNMFVAMTTQEQVAPLVVTQCPPLVRCVRRQDIRASWMIPLEVIYMTPLLAWNPYGVRYGVPQNVVTALGRTGLVSTRAYNGTNDVTFYWTPPQFFAVSTPENNDVADSSWSSRWVLDSKNTPINLMPSGTRIVLPEISGVGDVRLRYPIAPVHGEGGGVWKELNALKSNLALQISKLAAAFH